MKHNFQDTGRKIARWHRWLTGNAPHYPDVDCGEEDNIADKSGNVAALAELRRCLDIRDVMMTRAFGRLVSFVHPEALVVGASSALTANDIESLARTALVLSRVERCSQAGSVPKMMSATTRGGTPCISSVRANVLFASPDADEACRCLLGLLPLLQDGSPALDAGDIHRAMTFWDSARRNWAMDYHVYTAADVA